MQKPFSLFMSLSHVQTPKRRNLEFVFHRHRRWCRRRRASYDGKKCRRTNDTLGGVCGTVVSVVASDTR